MKSLLFFSSAFALSLVSGAAFETDSMKPFPVLKTLPAHLQDANRGFQSAPSITASRGGRLWVAWHAGGTTEGDDNAMVVVSSGDGGKAWSAPLFAVDQDGPLRVIDPGLWTDPDGKVWLFYAQCYSFWDGRGGVWAMNPEDPESERTAWSLARRLCDGFLKNKPVALKDGRWLLPAEFVNSAPIMGKTMHVLTNNVTATAHPMPERQAANAFVSSDKGETVSFLGAAAIPEKDRNCTENMIVERKDGTLWMLARLNYGIAESTSADGGKTWSPMKHSGIESTTSRFFVGRLKSGALLLVKNGDRARGPAEKAAYSTPREKITAFVSDDDGKTWLGGLVLDARGDVSYPDACETPDGFIHVVHDRGRTTVREILHHRFTEADVRAGRIVSAGSRLGGIVNKAGPKSAARPAPTPVLRKRLAADCDVFGIVHWGLNTFTDKEWGYGDEDPKLLNPSDFDAEQIVRACAEGGLKGLVLVAKHHDGFCLWPTKTTEHNIAKSPFRGGKGDYVREMEQACRKFGFKFGVYVSPWDRNNANYANPEYVKVFHEQVRELLCGDYGEIFEMWFDGANGGDGWYGGAKETRSIPKDYYRFDDAFAMVRKLQPDVCFFAGHTGAEFRWPWNERGILDPDSRATYMPGEQPTDIAENVGSPTGTIFKVCEADFPLRKGWFYHASQKGQTRHGAYLMKLYLSSVGNGGVMDVGIAPDKRGRLDDEDVKALKDFETIRRAFFANEVTEPGKPFNVVLFEEDISRGEQVDGWEFTADGQVVLKGKSIGHKRIRTLDEPVAAAHCSFKVTASGPECPVVAWRTFFVDPALVKLVNDATTESGETDTAKWMTRTPPVTVDCGRQLFVDDHLVESAHGVVRHWNAPVKIDAPVVWPADGAAPAKTDGSSGGGDEPVNLTCATDGGLWWDPTRRKFRLWYQADWLGDVCYAESADGDRWTYPDLGIVKGTNRIFENDVLDSWCVVPDYTAANPYARWNLHFSDPGAVTPDRLWSSKDGIHFTSLGTGGKSCDRSTMYYDPFRGTWIFSLRDGWPMRCRRFFESKTFGGADCRWRWPGDKDAPAEAPVPEPWLMATNKPNWQLYSFDAVAYESLMLGVMEVLYNTPNDNRDGEKAGLPKQTGLHFVFSRDGKNYSRPRDTADVAPSGWGSGKWDTGYLSCIGGVCVIRDERLWFYYSALRGDGARNTCKPSWSRNGMYSNGSIGAATLRRDGFAGMVADGRGEIVTKPIAFTGKRLFVNAECLFGSVSAEVLDANGKPVPGYTAADCAKLSRRDATKAELVFKGGDLGRFAGQPVQLRFRIHCGTLYSFWISPSERGESRGWVAGGGPAYPGLRDL